MESMMKIVRHYAKKWALKRKGLNANGEMPMTCPLPDWKEL